MVIQFILWRPLEQSTFLGASNIKNKQIKYTYWLSMKYVDMLTVSVV
jgi:hypothetical protein